MPKGDGFFWIKPSSNPSLALTVAKGETKNGTSIVLEKDNGQPWQLWSLTKHENGSYSLTPKHAPERGLDDNGGKQNPGAKIDLWSYNANDQHLQWFIKPLAGSGVVGGAGGRRRRRNMNRRRSSRRTFCPARPSSSPSRRARSSPAPCAT